MRFSSVAILLLNTAVVMSCITMATAKEKKERGKKKAVKKDSALSLAPPSEQKPSMVLQRGVRKTEDLILNPNDPAPQLPPQEIKKPSSKRGVAKGNPGGQPKPTPSKKGVMQPPKVSKSLQPTSTVPSSTKQPAKSQQDSGKLKWQATKDANKASWSGRKAAFDASMSHQDATAEENTNAPIGSSTCKRPLDLNAVPSDDDSDGTTASAALDRGKRPMLP